MRTFLSALAIPLLLSFAVGVLGAVQVNAQGPTVPPDPCEECPETISSTHDTYPNVPLWFESTSHHFPVDSTTGDLLWWYDGATGGIKYAPALIDVTYSGACGGLGQGPCTYYFILDENGLLSTRNPTQISHYNCVIANYSVENWDILDADCGDSDAGACYDDDYQGSVNVSHFTDTDLILYVWARLGATCTNGCAYLEKIKYTSDDPQAGSHGLRPVDQLITCPVFSSYSWSGASSVTITRDEFSWWYYEPKDFGDAVCEGYGYVCLPYKFE